MSTIRVAKRRRFTQMDRRSINDPSISLKALGLLVWLLDKPDDWVVSIERMAAILPDGRHAIAAGMKELEAGGYIDRRRYRDDGGRWTSETVVYEHPDLRPPEQETGSGAGEPPEPKTGSGPEPKTGSGPEPVIRGGKSAADNRLPLTETDDPILSTEDVAPNGAAAGQGKLLDIAPDRDDPDPRSSKVRAARIVRDVLERRKPTPTTPFVAMHQLAVQLLDAGHTDAALTAAMMNAAVMTRNGLELELARPKNGAPQANEPGMITDRSDTPSARRVKL